MTHSPDSFCDAKTVIKGKYPTFKSLGFFTRLKIKLTKKPSLSTGLIFFEGINYYIPHKTYSYKGKEYFYEFA